MKNAFFKFILWCVGAIAISAVTMIVLYRLAYFIAAMLGLLLIGAIVGIPLVMVFKSKFREALRNSEEENRYKSKLEEEFLNQFGGKK